MHPSVHYGIDRGIQDMETTEVPFDGRSGKEDAIVSFCMLEVDAISTELASFPCGVVLLTEAVYCFPVLGSTEGAQKTYHNGSQRKQRV